MTKTYKKIDENTVEETTTFDTPEPTAVELDKAVLQMELDRIPDMLAGVQEQVDAVNKRKVELIEILKVFN